MSYVWGLDAISTTSFKVKTCAESVVVQAVEEVTDSTLDYGVLFRIDDGISDALGDNFQRLALNQSLEELSA